MDSSQELSSNDKEVVEESGNMPDDSMNEESIDGQESAGGHSDSGKRPSGWQRLKRKNQEHEREIRDLHARIAELQTNAQQNLSSDYGYSQQGLVPGTDETIQKAVSYALQQRDAEERKAKQAEIQAQIANEYSELQRHLDQTSDKYDDFDDVVRGSHLPFTDTIRDAALLLPKTGPGSAGEVLYKLGKNPDDLSRISKLPPHKQASEVIKLSHALISGGENKSSSSNRPLGTIKANPVVNSVGVTDKTPPSQIRALMKAGKFK